MFFLTNSPNTEFNHFTTINKTARLMIKEKIIYGLRSVDHIFAIHQNSSKKVEKFFAFIFDRSLTVF